MRRRGSDCALNLMVSTFAVSVRGSSNTIAREAVHVSVSEIPVLAEADVLPMRTCNMTLTSDACLRAYFVCHAHALPLSCSLVIWLVLLFVPSPAPPITLIVSWLSLTRVPVVLLGVGVGVCGSRGVVACGCTCVCVSCGHLGSVCPCVSAHPPALRARPNAGKVVGPQHARECCLQA